MPMGTIWRSQKIITFPSQHFTGKPINTLQVNAHVQHTLPAALNLEDIIFFEISVLIYFI